MKLIPVSASTIYNEMKEAGVDIQHEHPGDMKGGSG